MNIAVVQNCPILGDLRANLDSMLQALRSCTADLVVFPELATCGYFFQSFTESGRVALEAGSEVFDLVAEVAKQRSQTVVFGFAERDGDAVYNSAMLIKAGSGERVVYRKTHLFYKERYCFHPGDRGFVVVNDEVLGARIGMMICYDWRFPEAARTLTLMGADVIVCPSNLVTHIWPKVMPARAIENKVYLAVANRYGSETCGDETVSFNGLSAIYAYNGDAMVQAAAEGEAVLYADCDPLKTRDKSFNAVNDILKDRRPEYYL